MKTQFLNNHNTSYPCLIEGKAGGNIYILNKRGDKLSITLIHNSDSHSGFDIGRTYEVSVETDITKDYNFLPSEASVTITNK